MSNTTDEPWPGPDEGPSIRIQFAREFRTIPEVTEVLTILDRAWILATRVARTAAVLDDLDREHEARNAPGEPSHGKILKRFPAREIDEQTRQIRQLHDLLADRTRGTRPEVKLSLQSPLVVEFNDLAYEAWALKEFVLGGGLTIAGWRVFKYFVTHAEDVAGLPHRVRAGWYRDRARADDAATAAAVARWRRALIELELEQSDQIDEVGRALRALGPLEIESNLPDEPEA